MICCCSSDTPMYACGGANTALTTFYNLTDKILWTAETASAVSSANISTARAGAAGLSNPGVAAYIAGGETSAATQVVTADKITFSNDTDAAVTTANLSQARDQLAAFSNTTTAGYYAGGSTTGGGAGSVKTADKLTFSGDSTAAVTTANLSQARLGLAGITQGSTKGYFAGGSTGGVTNTVTTADKLTFAGDSTAAQASANLSFHRYQLQAGGDGSTFGYWLGGQTGAVSTIVDKITFSTDTTMSRTSAAFDRYGGGMASNGSKIFAAGGTDSVSGGLNTVRKFTIATETGTTNISGTLGTGRLLVAGAGYQGL